jgi:uncharacterized LabA/DUF88 family protein
MRNIAIYIDVSNLYFCLKSRYEGKKLSYQRLIDFCSDWGEIKVKCAYGATLDKEQSISFITALEKIGITTMYKKAKVIRTKEGIIHKGNQDIQLCVDAIINSVDCDIVVLCTADGDFAPLIEYLKDNNKTVYVVACNISFELARVADEIFEIPESLLE